MLAGLVLAGLAGCGGDDQTLVSSGPSGEPLQGLQFAELIAQARPPIADLPVPVGFDLDEGRSRSFEAAGARYIDHVYRGRGSKFDVKRFYERHMPTNRWSLVTDMFIRGDIKIDFEKQTEKCRVEVFEGGFWSATEIRVAVWTSGPLPADRNRK